MNFFMGFVNCAISHKKCFAIGPGINHILQTVMMAQRHRNFLRDARQGAAALCLLVFLTLQAMATFPALHALVHNDSTDPSHSCAVTMFLQGQVHASSAAVNIVRSAPIFYAQPLFAAADFVVADVQLLPSRGPPVFLPVI